MFKSIVNFFSKGESTDTPLKEKLNGKKVTEVTGVTVKVQPIEQQIKKHTKATLNKLTKNQLEELGRSEFGVELDRRKKKDDLIKQLLKEQKVQK